MAYGRLKGYFPVSYGFLYKGTGYLPYCRECVDAMYTAYLRASKDPKKAVRQMCRKLDLYWNPQVFDSVERSNSTRSVMTNYITRVNSVKLASKCYDDTLEEEGALWLEPKEYRSKSGKAPEAQSVKSSEEEDEAPTRVYVDPEITDFWGSDFEPEFVLKLDKRYKDWTEDLDQLDKGSISLFKQICILEETITRDAAMGKPVDKNMNTLNTLLGSANLKPVQKKSDADIAMENTPLGVWIERWETKRPVPEPDPELQDVDGVVKYITTWFFGHISHALGIKNVPCEMYEKELEKMRIRRPELAEEDDESLFNKIFGSSGE